jgi:glycyl-tRNA synthetase beta chain
MTRSAAGRPRRGLKQVTFQEKLGTIYDKTRQVRMLAGTFRSFQSRQKASQRAAELCKADLLTGVVGEFPKLQGVMGRHYALSSGEDRKVADAILEHYLPRFAGDRLPESLEGVCVGIADRIDTITGCFFVGLIPSGSEDPYGLRRQSVAILNMLLDRGLRISLTGLIAEACRGFERKNSLEADTLDFLRQRLAGMLASKDSARCRGCGAVRRFDDRSSGARR